MDIPGALQSLGTFISNKSVQNHPHSAPHQQQNLYQHYPPREDLPVYDRLDDHKHLQAVHNSYEDDIAPAAGSDDELNAEKLKDMSMLPTASRIEEIITSLKNFSVRNSMPPKIVFTETADDLAIQENVTMLFSEAVCDRLRLIESLKLVLLTEDSLMSEAQKKNIRKQKEKRLDLNQKQDIKRFYPCLVALMKVLLIRCDEKIQQSTSVDATINHILLVMWRNVMSKLGEIFSVIIYGKNQGFIDLGTFPTDWSEIIKENNQMIQTATRSAREINNKILELKQRINKRNEAIEKINEEYAGYDSELKLCESKSTGVGHLVDSLTHVEQMVKKNKADIAEIQRS